MARRRLDARRALTDAATSRALTAEPGLALGYASEELHADCEAVLAYWHNTGRLPTVLLLRCSPPVHKAHRRDSRPFYTALTYL